MLETFLKALIVVNFLTTFAILVYVAKRQHDCCINKDEVIASQEVRIQRLFSENVALETNAIKHTNFGNDFIKQPVHGEQKPVRVNLTTLEQEKSEGLPDWSLEFECQTDPSFW
jgi:hypothetical protein